MLCKALNILDETFKFLRFFRNFSLTNFNLKDCFICIANIKILYEKINTIIFHQGSRLSKAIALSSKNNIFLPVIIIKL